MLISNFFGEVRSRLGCQVKMSKQIDGLTVRLPSMTRNLQSSDFSKKS